MNDMQIIEGSIEDHESITFENLSLLEKVLVPIGLSSIGGFIVASTTNNIKMGLYSIVGLCVSGIGLKIYSKYNRRIK